jgi:hypothetical protein
MANAAVGRWVGCGQGMPTKRDSGSEFAGGGFRGIGPALAGNVGQVGLSRCARGVSGCGRSYARFGPVPRLLGAASCRTGTRVVSLRARAFAGSGLRSQGTWGQVGLSRCARGGFRMWTFLCSLRPGPAAAGCGQLSNGDSGSEFAGGGFRGIGPALAGNVGAGRAFALCARGFQDVDVPMLASARSRGCWVRPAVERGLGVVSVRAGARGPARCRRVRGSGTGVAGIKDPGRRASRIIAPRSLAGGLGGQQPEDVLLLEVPLAQGSREHGVFEVLEVGDVEGAVDVVFQ